MARRAPMAHMSWRASPLLLCALPSSIGADTCDCGQYGATQAWNLEQRGAACDSVPADHHGPCFQSCCCEGCAWLTEQPTGTAAPAPTNSSSGPRWWLWLVNVSPERSVCVLHCSLQTCQQHTPAFAHPSVCMARRSSPSSYWPTLPFFEGDPGRSACSHSCSPRNARAGVRYAR
jgi:hypothetical protein